MRVRVKVRVRVRVKMRVRVRMRVRAVAKYATLTACQRATTGRSPTCEEGGKKEGRWEECKEEEKEDGERGGGEGFDQKDQGLRFAPARKKP